MRQKKVTKRLTRTSASCVISPMTRLDSLSSLLLSIPVYNKISRSDKERERVEMERVREDSTKIALGFLTSGLNT